MYFENFPTVSYTNVLGGDTTIVTNILKRIGARDAVKNSITFFTKYNVRGSETPEQVAFDFYGDAELHWVILLVNDIYDRYHQWPMNVNQFQAYLEDKYADANAVHHYEITQSSGDTTVTINIGTDNSLYGSATAVTNYEYEEKEQDKKRQINILDSTLITQFVREYKSLQTR
tara:strand:- start:1865 stop:2383 length:519 start_codon:yes stop_codon:yes gene_type:complete